MKLISYSTIILLLFVYCNVDHGLEPVRSAITGEITFTGEWPEEPLEVRIITSVEFPPSDFNEIIIGEPIPTNVSSYKYTQYLKAGIYKVLIPWLEK